MRHSGIIYFYLWRELIYSTSICILVLTVILIFGNLTKYEETLLIALEHSPVSLIKLVALLLPYVLSMSIPFGFSLALTWNIAKWSNFKELDAMRSLGVGAGHLYIPILSFALLLCALILYSSLQWGPVNRKKFDEFRSDLAWSNLSRLMENKGEISFSTNEDQKFLGKQTLSSLAGLSNHTITRVSLSALNINQESWEGLRLCLHDPEDQLLAVINAGKAKVKRDQKEGILSLELFDIDLEPSHQGGDFFSGTDSIFVKIKRLKEPIVFQISSPNNENLKRVGYSRLIEIATTSLNDSKKKIAQEIMSKHIAISLSPFFICIFLIPHTAKFAKGDPSVGVVVGIVICVGYFVLGTLGHNFLIFTQFSYLGWWIPNILFLAFTILPSFIINSVRY